MNQNKCKKCGGCGKCCANHNLYGILQPLLRTEKKILMKFSELPFLPVAFGEGSHIPICLDFDGDEKENGRILLELQRKGLIDIDRDVLLNGYSYDIYTDYPEHGSMALTGLGQEYIDCMNIQEA